MKLESLYTEENRLKLMWINFTNHLSNEGQHQNASGLWHVCTWVCRFLNKVKLLGAHVCLVPASVFWFTSVNFTTLCLWRSQRGLCAIRNISTRPSVATPTANKTLPPSSLLREIFSCNSGYRKSRRPKARDVRVAWKTFSFAAGPNRGNTLFTRRPFLAQNLERLSCPQ